MAVFEGPGLERAKGSAEAPLRFTHPTGIVIEMERKLIDDDEVVDIQYGGLGTCIPLEIVEGLGEGDFQRGLEILRQTAERAPADRFLATGKHPFAELMQSYDDNDTV